MSLEEIKNLIKGGIFNSPSKGTMNLGLIINELIDYKKEIPEARYKIVIGTDSFNNSNVVFFHIGQFFGQTKITNIHLGQKFQKSLTQIENRHLAPFATGQR